MSSSSAITPAPIAPDARDVSDDVIADASFDVASDDVAVVADGSVDDGGDTILTTCMPGAGCCLA